jgi:hypothetical protein
VVAHISNLVLQKPRQEDGEVQASLNFIARLLLHKTKQRKTTTTTA